MMQNNNHVVKVRFITALTALLSTVLCLPLAAHALSSKITRETPYTFDFNVQSNKVIYNYLKTELNENRLTDVNDELAYISENYDDTDAVELLLQHGASLGEIDESQNTALHLAARGGKLNTVKLLLNKGVVLNRKNKFGFTPLVMAAQTDERDMYDFLLSIGATSSQSYDAIRKQAIHSGWQYSPLSGLVKAVFEEDNLTLSELTNKLKRRPHGIGTVVELFDNKSERLLLRIDEYFIKQKVQQTDAENLKKQKKICTLKEKLALRDQRIFDKAACLNELKVEPVKQVDIAVTKENAIQLNQQFNLFQRTLKHVTTMRPETVHEQHIVDVVRGLLENPYTPSYMANQSKSKVDITQVLEKIQLRFELIEKRLHMAGKELKPD